MRVTNQMLFEAQAQQDRSPAQPDRRHRHPHREPHEGVRRLVCHDVRCDGGEEDRQQDRDVGPEQVRVEAGQHGEEDHHDRGGDARAPGSVPLLGPSGTRGTDPTDPAARSDLVQGAVH